MSLLREALAYAEQGLEVFPCHSLTPIEGRLWCTCGNRWCDSPGKHPRTKNGHKNASTDPGQVRSWWRLNPDANIAAPVPAAFFVLDLDGEGAVEWWESRLDEYVEDPATWRIQTGRGRHLWFGTPQPVKSRTGASPLVKGDGWKVEIRGHGGYVMMPPSKHHCGTTYHFLEGPFPRTMDAIADRPAWLASMLETAKVAKDAKLPDGPEWFEIASDMGENSGRDSFLVKYTGKLISVGMPAKTIEETALLLNSKFKTPLPEDKARAEIKGCISRYEHAGELATLKLQARHDADLAVLNGTSPNGHDPDAGPEPYALSLQDFIARKLSSRPPLLGTEEDNLLPAGGLLILVGKGGRGKTTVTIEACLHLASGTDWLGFKVERPLRILFIENEGPREPFRRKLEAKLEHWDAEISGAFYIKTLDWGAFTAADEGQRRQLRAFIEQERIDLVVGDPLDSLGINGIGSPADTREFMAQLVVIGLTRDVAFWLLHHPVKAEFEDELDQASGAWGGRPDTMLNLSVLPGSRSRLSFPKVRWGGVSERPAFILAFDATTQGFEKVAEEGNQERDLFQEILDLMADGKPRTLKEIVAPKQPKDGGPPGIGANEAAVREILENDPDTFASFGGKEVGRSPRATLWRLLATASEGPTQSTQSTAPRPGNRATASLRPTYMDKSDADAVQSGAATSPTQSTQSPSARHVIGWPCRKCGGQTQPYQPAKPQPGLKPLRRCAGCGHVHTAEVAS
jgi:Bifunctional DNA primase/polymerase, N-terminal/AAA domain